MSFHQQLFKEKGWKPSSVFAKVCLVSVVRSDMSNDRKYCKGFYLDLVSNLDKLEFQRGRGSIDLDEVAARLMLHRPNEEVNMVNIDLIRHGRRPVVFYCEDSPINKLSTMEFAKELCGIIEQDTYAILAFDAAKNNLVMGVFDKGTLTHRFVMETRNKVVTVKEDKDIDTF